jgi:hypothetical protein
MHPDWLVCEIPWIQDLKEKKPHSQGADCGAKGFCFYLRRENMKNHVLLYIYYLYGQVCQEKNFASTGRHGINSGDHSFVIHERFNMPVNITLVLTHEW